MICQSLPFLRYGCLDSSFGASFLCIKVVHGAKEEAKKEKGGFLFRFVQGCVMWNGLCCMLI